ncbi:hypothetical protein BGW80DRAFT_216816 [Lactifluus volemus]|nr:hypothetical protein BGW80DRAFT_216816 [Lactifluus volemus]
MEEEADGHKRRLTRTDRTYSHLVRVAPNSEPSLQPETSTNLPGGSRGCTTSEQKDTRATVTQVKGLLHESGTNV